MKELFLTDELCVLLDDEDYFNIGHLYWYPLFGTGTLYARASIGDKEVLMHRHIMCVSDNMIIDHIDRNGLNNQKHNLRIVNKRQNNINRIVPQSVTGTGYRGVRYSKSGRLEVFIKDETGRQKHIGTYDTIREALLAYNDAAIRFQGEYAILHEVIDV